jgi:predicted nucleic acid-binding protein
LALVKGIFFDTSVLLGGLIELRSPQEAAHRIMEAVADGRVSRPKTAWHCCLEFYAVSTRLPEEVRLSPTDSLRLIEEEIFRRFAIRELPAGARLGFLKRAVAERAAGGRVYDAHIAEIALRAWARLVATENVRHFSALRSQGVEILGAEELADRLRL